MAIKSFQAIAESVKDIQSNCDLKAQTGESVLVTGGFGFLGSHICTQLSQAGNKVIILSRRKVPKFEFQAQTKQYQLEPILSNITFLYGDISLKNWGLTYLPPIKRVIHAAAELNVVKNYNQLKATNTFGVLPLIRIMEAGIPCTHLSTLSVFASSNYKDKTRGSCLPDASLTNLQGLEFYGGYAQSKLAAELLLKNQVNSGVLDIVRLSLVVGKIQPEKDLLLRFLTLMRTINCLPEQIPLEELNQIDVQYAAQLLIDRSSKPIRHVAAEDNTTLEELLYPLKLKTDGKKFSEKISVLKGLDKALIMNAFFKPQPLKNFNFDIFHSTGLTFH